MPRPDRLLLIALAVLAGLAGACAPDATAPTTSSAPAIGRPSMDEDEDEEDDEGCDDDDDDDPCFLRPSDDAPSLVATTTSVWAVRGQARTARLVYRPRAGASDSTEFVRLTIPAAAELRRPDGQLVALGDSILVTLTVTDASRGIVRFEPAGLGFGTTYPATLTFDAAETDDDVNGDGTVDATDAALRATFVLWRRATLVDPWAALPSTRSGSTVTASISSFTYYAIAY